AVLLVGLRGDVAPAQIACLRRSHASVGHDEHEIVGHRAIPGAKVVAGSLDPTAREAVQFAVFGRGEFLAAGLAEGKPALEDLAVPDEFLAGGVGHDRAERRHLVADRAVADASARSAFAVLLPPGGEGLPTVFAELCD